LEPAWDLEPGAWSFSVKGLSLCLLLVLSAAISMSAPNKDEFVTRENAVWNAFKNHDIEQVKKFVSTDLLAVYPDGIYNFERRLGSMHDVDMKSFVLSDFSFTSPSEQIAVVSYKAKVEGNDGSTRALNCGTVWNLKNAEWKAVFHADMPEDKK